MRRTAAFDLVVIGLLVSVPIVVSAARWCCSWWSASPSSSYVGAGVLAFTAAKMIVSEPLLDALYDPHLLLRLATYVLLIAGVIGAGWWAARRAGTDSRSLA